MIKGVLPKETTTRTEQFFTPSRVAFTILILSLFAALASSSCNSSDNAGKTTNSSPRVTANPGKPAPAPATTSVLPATVLNAELKAISGSPIKISDYAGKVLIVNLWATWCGPCRLEIPELVKFHKEYRAQGLEIVGLSTEDPEYAAAAVRQFAKEYEIGYRVGWATRELAVTLMSGNTSIPQSFVISRDGRLLKRFIGFSRQATPPQLRQAIEEALKS